jgi:hypothetical protein
MAYLAHKNMIQLVEMCPEVGYNFSFVIKSNDALNHQMFSGQHAHLTLMNFCCCFSYASCT